LGIDGRDTTVLSVVFYLFNGLDMVQRFDDVFGYADLLGYSFGSGAQFV
jgi:hypothetical protein